MANATDLKPKGVGGAKGTIPPSTATKKQGRPKFRGPKDKAGKAAGGGK